jgi:cytochrome c553
MAVDGCQIARRRDAASALLFAAALLFLGAGGARAATLQDKIAQCAACHGENGQSAQANIPHIGGQPKLFVMYQLFFYREGRRKSEEMNIVAKELSDADLQAVSDYVAKLPPPAPLDGPIDAARYARGAEIAQKRFCASCHNPDYSGREQMARLAGQRETYLLKALQDFRTGVRVGTQASMAEAVRGLSDADLADLAYFQANFRPKRP